MSHYTFIIPLNTQATISVDAADLEEGHALACEQIDDLLNHCSTRICIEGCARSDSAVAETDDGSGYALLGGEWVPV